jgi:integration host factor subunit alpha
MTLTKKRLIHSVKKSTGLPATRCAGIVENLIETMKAKIQMGEEISIRGFGKISVRGGKRSGSGHGRAAGKIARHSRKQISFKCSNVLRDKLNRGS